MTTLKDFFTWSIFLILYVTLVASTRGKSPCTLSYFDLWKKADSIFSCEVLNVGRGDDNFRVRIEKIIKTNRRIKLENETAESTVGFTQDLQDLYCDRRFQVGQTRIIFVEYGDSSSVRVLRAPELRSWLLSILQSIYFAGENIFRF